MTAEYIPIAITTLVALALFVGYCTLVARLSPWLRLPLVLLSLVGVFYTGTKYGRLTEQVSLTSEYGRFVGLSYYSIAEHLKADNVDVALHISTNLSSSFYIAPRDKRRRHIQTLYDILQIEDNDE